MNPPEPTLQAGLVSVIIPTYNRAELVVQAIQSVRAQTWEQVQIIVVDDGSTDDTIAALAQFSEILLLTQKRGGQAKARNHGLSHARGEYVSTLDSDDFWQPTFLERSIEALVQLEADFVFSNWDGYDATRDVQYQSYFEYYYGWQGFPLTELDTWRLLMPLQARAMFLDSCVCPSSGVVFKRDRIVNGWTTGLHIGDDWCLLRDVSLSRPCRVAFTMDKLWTKRVVGDNIYDGICQQEVLRKLHYADGWLMFDRFDKMLTPDERYHAIRKLTFFSANVVKLELRSRNVPMATVAAFRTLRAVVTAAASSPNEVFSKGWRRIVKRLRPSPLVAESVRVALRQQSTVSE